jgi:signal transduction histidine kinase
VKPFLGGLLPRLFASVILPFSVVLLALAVAAIGVHERSMRSIVAVRDERSARAAAAAVSEVLLHRQVTVHELAFRLSDRVPATQVVAEAGSLDHDFPEGLAVVSGSGRIVAGFLTPHLRDSALLARALAASSDAAETLQPPLAADGVGVATAAAPRRGLFVVGAFRLLDLLRFALPDLESRAGRDSAVIFDPQAGVLAHDGAPPLETDYMDHPGVRAALQGKSGSSYIDSPNGEEHVLAFSPIRSAGWVLVIEEPWSAVVSPVLRLSLLSPLALVPALVISLIGLWFATRQIVAPLRTLQRQSLKLAAGDFAAIEEKVGGVQEIRELQRSMTEMARRIQSAQQSLRSYIGRVTSAQEEERRRLARDLHDETIQDLIALDQKIQLAARSLRAESPEARGLEAIHREAREAIRKVHRLSRALRPAYLEDLGLLPALEALAEDVGSSLGIPIVVSTSGTRLHLPQDADLAVYRIAQEALANVARHAAAHRALVTLQYRRDEFRLTVKDDGVGFTPPKESGELSRTGHFGLIGMQERAQFIGARLEVHSAPGRGTRVTLRLPVSWQRPSPP